MRDITALRARLTDPLTGTLALTVAMAVTAVVLLPYAGRHALLAASSGPAGHGLFGVLTGRAEPAALAVLVLLGVLFFVTELGQALIEVRRQAYSFSMSGIPLVLGLLYLGPGQLVGVRLAASVVAFLVQRAAAVKFAFNTASYYLDTVLVLVLCHQLLGGDRTLDLRTVAVVYVVVALVDVVMSLLVLLVIRINQGPVGRAEVGEVLGPASVFVLLNTGIAAIVAAMLDEGALGGVLIALFAVTTTGLYRGYLVLRRRHQSLQLVHEFVEASETTGNVEQLAGALLVRIRALLRASRVELRLDCPDPAAGNGVPGAAAGGPLRVTVTEDDEVRVVTNPRRDGDTSHPPTLTSEAARLCGQDSDPATRRWLARNNAHDALVVPLTRTGTRGTLVALDRLGDTTRFTEDDLALLQTLAGHLAVAVQSTRLVERLTRDATHDALTGLPNRGLLTDRLRAALSDVPTAGTPTSERRVAVLLLDLDRFKEVNDALGHHVGDELLAEVAKRLLALPLPGATIARLGGDEFAVLLPDVAGDTAAQLVAQQVADALAAPVDLPEATVSTRASIGIAIGVAGDEDADLLRHADTAMYAAKGEGRAHTLYTPDLDAGRADRLALLADLHLAIERDELELYYQPKLDLAFGLVTGVEALVRWTHPTLGPLSPDVFVPLAESTGLIDQLTSLVLRKALRQCRAWRDAGLELSMAVNLSARNVANAGLPDHVAVALVDAGLPAQLLTLEITESSVMTDPDRSVATLERLAAIGVTLSLDDFGTGYSSLSYLQRLPVREVKIDRSFVLGLDHPERGHASDVLVRSIVSLGASLGLRIVAEGVESTEVLERLRALGCDLVQGFHVSRPLPPDQLLTLLTTTKPGALVR